MKVLHPQIKVTLIKTKTRDGLSFQDKKPNARKGAPTAQRYKDATRIDLTQFLGDGTGVRTTKSVREPAGGFSITLMDMMHPKLKESLYAMIEPMDIVEIRFCHDAAVLKKGKQIPIIMRGFVSEVTRDESMGQDGKPVRKVILSGQDSGKILQTLIIYYLNNAAIQSVYLTGFDFFQKYGMGVTNQNAIDFIGEVVSKVLNPYLAKIVDTGRDAVLGKGFVPKVAIAGATSPYTLASFQDVSLHAMLSAMLDVGAFNEMYVEDQEDELWLVVRPAQFANANDEAVYPITGQAYGYAKDGIRNDIVATGKSDMPIILDDDIQSLTATRTDQGVANWYWVTANRWILVDDIIQKLVLQNVGDNDLMYKFNYPNCAGDLYGFRKMEIDSALMPELVMKNGRPTGANRTEQDAWIKYRRDTLGETNKDNVVFESGTMRVSGNEAIKPGSYARVKRGTAVGYKIYVVSVDHDYVPFQGFFTTIHYERGMGFIDRARQSESPYLQERNEGGIR